MSKFQLALTGIFVICIVAGAGFFATYKGSTQTNTIPTVSIWGTFPKVNFDEFVNKLNQTRTNSLIIQYTEIPQANFRQTFIEELARGKGPDIILIPQQEIMGYYDKIVQIPNKILTQRDFQNTFIPQADLYLTEEGTLAVPFILDPMVMFWNRSIFTNAGIAQVPKYWDEFGNIAKKITIKDDSSNIKRSTLALGEFYNIEHAREILSTLFLQAGNPISYFSNNSLTSVLGDGDYTGSKTSVPAVTFFTQFSNSRSPQYSWNRSLLSSKNSFIAGTLATYFGFASEIGDIRIKNPNLNFDIAAIPQARNGVNRSTYGNLYGLSIVRSAANQNDSYSIIKIITEPDASSLLSTVTYLPSPRRDIISSGSTDPYMSIFLDASLIAKGWLDTNVLNSNRIFTTLVESVTSGRADANGAIKQAHDDLNASFKN